MFKYRRRTSSTTIIDPTDVASSTWAVRNPCQHERYYYRFEQLPVAHGNPSLGLGHSLLWDYPSGHEILRQAQEQRELVYCRPGNKGKALLDRKSPTTYTIGVLRGSIWRGIAGGAKNRSSYQALHCCERNKKMVAEPEMRSR